MKQGRNLFVNATAAEAKAAGRRRFHASVVPFSSVVGSSVMLTDAATGMAVAVLSISIPSPSLPYRETAEAVAKAVADATNGTAS